jgi:hypothetical protein
VTRGVRTASAGKLWTGDAPSPSPPPPNALPPSADRPCPPPAAASAPTHRLPTMHSPPQALSDFLPEANRALFALAERLTRTSCRVESLDQADAAVRCCWSPYALCSHQIGNHSQSLRRTPYSAARSRSVGQLGRARPIRGARKGGQGAKRGEGFRTAHERGAKRLCARHAIHQRVHLPVPRARALRRLQLAQRGVDGGGCGHVWRCTPARPPRVVHPQPQPLPTRNSRRCQSLLARSETGPL